MNARLARAVATTCGLGDRLPAPGTFAGSLPAALAWWALAAALPARLPLALATAALVALAVAVGIPAAGAEAARRGRHDPGPVVVDEVAGQWLAYLAALPLLPPGLPLWRAVAGGFLLFRAFDIVKPWPVRRLERLPGGLGIVADDLAAGLEAGLALALVARLLAG